MAEWDFLLVLSMTNPFCNPSFDMNIAVRSYQAFREQLKQGGLLPHTPQHRRACAMPTEPAVALGSTLLTGQLAQRCRLLRQQGKQKKNSLCTHFVVLFRRTTNLSLQPAASPKSAETPEPEFVETEHRIKSSRPLTARFREPCLLKKPG